MPRHRPPLASGHSQASTPPTAPPHGADRARRAPALPDPDDAGTLVVDTARAALDTLPEAWRRSLGDLRASPHGSAHTRHAESTHTRAHRAGGTSATLAERHDPRLRHLATTALDASWRHELALRIDTTSPHRVTVDRGDDYQAGRLGDRARQRAAQHIAPATSAPGCSRCSRRATPSSTRRMPGFPIVTGARNRSTISAPAR
jgi:hypothetical protein